MIELSYEDSKMASKFNFQGIEGVIFFDSGNIKADGSGLIEFSTGEHVSFYILEDMIHFEGFLSTDVKAFLYDELIKLFKTNHMDFQ